MIKPSSAFLISALFVLLIAIHLLGALFPGIATWGFSQWSVVDRWTTLIALGIAALLALNPISSRIASSLKTIPFELSQATLVARILLVAVVSALLFYLFMSLRLHALVYGDGLTILAHVTQPQGNLIFDQYKTQALSIILFNKASMMGRDLFGLPPLSTFAAINSLAGVVGVWSLYAIAQLLGVSSAGKNAIMFSALASGAVLLFFGHIETYAWPLAMGLWAIYFTIRYVRGLSTLIPSVAFALAAAAFHAIALPFLFSVLTVALTKVFSERGTNTGRVSAIIILLMIAGSIGLATIGDYVRMPGVFVPLIPEPNNPYWALSFEHLRDIANALFFLAPVGILLLTASLFQNNTQEESNTENALAIFALATFLPAFWIDPALGAIRDWDLLSFYGAPLSIWGAYRVMNRTSRSSHGAIAVAAFVIVIIHLTPNIIEKRNPDTAVKFLDAALNNDPHYQTTYLSGDRLVSWGVILTHLNHRALAKKYFERILLVRRDSREGWFNLGLIHIDDNKQDSAILCFRESVNYYPHDTMSWYMLAQAHFELTQLPDALSSIREAEKLNPYDPSIQDMFGIILTQNRQYDSGVVRFRKSLELEPRSVETHTNLGIAFAMTKQFDSAYYYLKLAQKTDPKLVGIYPPLLDVELELGKYEECRRDLTFLRRMDPRNAVIRRIDAALRNAEDK